MKYAVEIPKWNNVIDSSVGTWGHVLYTGWSEGILCGRNDVSICQEAFQAGKTAGLKCRNNRRKSQLLCS